MTIVEALKTQINIRVSTSGRWLVWNEITNCWVVYEHTYGKPNSQILIETEDEEKAVEVLIGE